MELLASLPPELIALLERELLHAQDIDVFWARADAVRRAIDHADSDGQPGGAAQVLSSHLRAALEAALASGGLDHVALDELVDDWEALWMDEEKLLGHLLLAHGASADEVRGLGGHELLQRHAALHPSVT